MKKFNMSQGISGIDPRFIEEAVNHRPARVNRIKIIAIAACLAILVASIPLAMVFNRGDTSSSGGSVIENDGYTVNDNNNSDDDNNNNTNNNTFIIKEICCIFKGKHACKNKY